MAKKLTPIEQYYKDNPEAAAQEAHATQESERFYKEGALGRMTGPDAVATIDPNSIGQVQQVDTKMAGGDENISDAKTAYEKSQVRDSYVEDALKRMQSGLGGITAEENQALLEQGQRGIDQNQATALRQMRADQGEAGMTGSSAAAQRNRLYSQTNYLKQQNISDLIAKNVAEKGNRLAAYSGAAQASSNALASAQDSALGRLLGTRTDAANYTQKAQSMNQNADQVNAANRLSAMSTNADIGFKNAANNVATQQYNIGQGEKELAGKIGSFYGDISTSTARSSANKANALAKEGLKIAKGGVTGDSSKSKKSSSKKSSKKK